jgi:hypothetical protein
MSLRYGLSQGTNTDWGHLGTEQRTFENIWTKQKGSNNDGKNCIKRTLWAVLFTCYQDDHTKDMMDGASNMHGKDYNVYIVHWLGSEKSILYIWHSTTCRNTIRISLYPHKMPYDNHNHSEQSCTGSFGCVTCYRQMNIIKSTGTSLNCFQNTPKKVQCKNNIELKNGRN